MRRQAKKRGTARHRASLQASHMQLPLTMDGGSLNLNSMSAVTELSV